jgi:hypothetical protein
VALWKGKELVASSDLVKASETQTFVVGIEAEEKYKPLIAYVVRDLYDSRTISMLTSDPSIVRLLSSLGFTSRGANRGLEAMEYAPTFQCV